jgi:hypothetical protein
MSCHHINTTPDKRQLIQCIIFQSSCFNSVVFFISISANPKSLLNTVWLNNGVFCGFRGRQEHSSLMLGDLELKTDSSGKEYLEFNGIYICKNLSCFNQF